MHCRIKLISAHHHWGNLGEVNDDVGTSGRRQEKIGKGVTQRFLIQLFQNEDHNANFRICLDEVMTVKASLHSPVHRRKVRVFCFIYRSEMKGISYHFALV